MLIPHILQFYFCIAYYPMLCLHGVWADQMQWCSRNIHTRPHVVVVRTMSNMKVLQTYKCGPSWPQFIFTRYWPTDHCEGFITRKVGCSGYNWHGFLASINKVPILLSFAWIWPLLNAAKVKEDIHNIHFIFKITYMYLCTILEAKLTNLQKCWYNRYMYMI